MKICSYLMYTYLVVVGQKTMESCQRLYIEVLNILYSWPMSCMRGLFQSWCIKVKLHIQKNCFENPLHPENVYCPFKTHKTQPGVQTESSFFCDFRLPPGHVFSRQTGGWNCLHQLNCWLFCFCFADHIKLKSYIACKMWANFTNQIQYCNQVAVCVQEMVICQLYLIKL